MRSDSQSKSENRAARSRKIKDDEHIITNKRRRESSNNGPPEYAKRSRPNDEVSGSIIRHVCGNIVTEWKFPPYKKNCPVSSCSESFITRSDGINHYKSCHAMNAIMCYICDQPISTHNSVVSQSKREYIKHYKRKHPGVLDPFDFEANKKLPKMCCLPEKVGILLVFRGEPKICAYQCF